MVLKFTKRAMFYTLSATVIISLILIYSQVSLQDNFTVPTTRIKSIDYFVTNVKADSSFAIYAAGFRSFIVLQQQVENTGNYISNTNSKVSLLMNNGTYGNVSQILMENNTLPVWVSRMATQASRLGINFSGRVVNVSVYQTQAWAVDIAVGFELNYSDNRTGAKWVTNFVSNTSVPIEGFIDPLSIVETQNQFVYVINKTPYANTFVVGVNPANLTTHMSKGWFVAYGAAPSYLMRLEGNFSVNGSGNINSTYGIESLIDKVALSSVRPVNNSLSNVDHMYYSNNGKTTYTFSIMPGVFRLDNVSSGGVTRHQLYNLSKYTP